MACQSDIMNIIGKIISLGYWSNQRRKINWGSAEGPQPGIYILSFVPMCGFVGGFGLWWVR